MRLTTLSYSRLREEVTVPTHTEDQTTTPESEERLEFTIDEAIEAIGFGFFQLRLTLLASLVWVADAMEMMMLAVLAPSVQCLWSLSSYQEAMITTVVFLGTMLSVTPYGVISDM